MLCHVFMGYRQVDRNPTAGWPSSGTQSEEERNHTAGQVSSDTQSEEEKNHTAGQASSGTPRARVAKEID